MSKNLSSKIEIGFSNKSNERVASIGISTNEELYAVFPVMDIFNYTIVIGSCSVQSKGIEDDFSRNKLICLFAQKDVT
ncbi:MAG: hypothetical protein V4467_02780 [Patescibacteria group bacterium]